MSVTPGDDDEISAEADRNLGRLLRSTYGLAGEKLPPQTSAGMLSLILQGARRGQPASVSRSFFSFSHLPTVGVLAVLSVIGAALWYHNIRNDVLASILPPPPIPYEGHCTIQIHPPPPSLKTVPPKAAQESRKQP